MCGEMICADCKKEIFIQLDKNCRIVEYYRKLIDDFAYSFYIYFEAYCAKCGHKTNFKFCQVFIKEFAEEKTDKELLEIVLGQNIRMSVADIGE